MRKITWIILAVVAVLALFGFVIGRFIYYGTGSAGAYSPPDRPRATVQVEAAPMSARLQAVDNPVDSRGVLVIDYAHNNALFVEELNVLLSKVVDRGYSYEILARSSSDDEENGNGNGLAAKLRYAQALLLPLPRSDYSPEEITEIKRFVDKGGRVLMISDPTRTLAVEPINSIAGAFDIIYANDYLYSLESNDNNYRNVVYTNFADSPLTQGLDEESKIIFYSGNSVYAPDQEIILADDVTYSSTSEGGRNLAAAALTSDDKVLALGDLTFFGEPYSNAENNEMFINNIADFLARDERSYDFKDFPYLFNPTIDIVYDNALVFNSQFDDSVRLKETLEAQDFTVNFVDEIGSENDVIFVGRYEDTAVVQEYLDAAGITIFEADEKTEEEELLVDDEAEADENRLALINDEPFDEEASFVEGRIQIEGIGELEKGGSTLFHLHEDGDRNILIILSANSDTNADAFDLLIDQEFTDCMVNPTTAICQTEEPGDRLPPSLRSFRIDNILIVSDNSGRKRDDAQTSVLEYFNVLSDTYRVDTLSTLEEGYPELEEMLEYDAIVWTTGDYWDDSVGAEGAELLTKYVELGGNLILSGASIAFDWEHTDFLANVVHAQYHSFGEQTDLQVALPNHPLSKDIKPNDTISFEESPSGEPVMSDVVSNMPDARVIFNRGSQSEEAGAASVIAYEDTRAKIAYFAFPIYLLPAEAQTQLINNTVDWFSKKPLPLPNGSGAPLPSEEDPPAEDKEAVPEDDTGQNGEDENGNGNGNGDNGENGKNGNG